MGSLLPLSCGWSNFYSQPEISSAHSHLFKRLKRLKSCSLSPKGILFQFVSTSVHIFPISSPPYLLVGAARTRHEHGIPALITLNPNTDMIHHIFLMPHWRSCLSLSETVTLKSGNSGSTVTLLPFSVSPTLHLHARIPYSKTMLYCSYSMIFNLGHTQTCIAYLNAVLQTGLLCTSGTFFNFHLFSLSWCHLQNSVVILLFIVLDKIPVGADEELTELGYRNIFFC